MPSRKFRRVTRHYAIETEPSWMPDGRSLVFTSDRGGRPQIYRIDLASGRTERLTYEGSWNARASVAADGRTMVLVHQADGAFHIAVQDLERERLLALTCIVRDEIRRSWDIGRGLGGWQREIPAALARGGCT
jgi:TolB protein